MARTDVLLVPSVPVQLLADLVDFEPFGSPTAELVACRGVTESHMGQCYAATSAKKKNEKF